MTFELHPRLAADTALITDWPLSRVLLMVPRRTGITELFELDESARAMLMGEIARASERLKSGTRADKINIGIIGNVVAQPHIHVVARAKTDSVWPGTVWGAGRPIAYAPPELQRVVRTLRELMDQ